MYTSKVPPLKQVIGTSRYPSGRSSKAVLRALLGWVIYLAFFGLVLRYGALRETLASLRISALRAGWIFALITAGMQLFVILAFFVTDLTLLWEVSFFNVYTSLGTALAGGVGEEIAYRGVVVLRLKAAGASKTTQVLVSGLLFGLAHASWSGAAAGAGLVAVVSPVLGTAVPGGLFARAFQLSGYRILPVIVAHFALNLIMEPALLLSYFAG